MYLLKVHGVNIRESDEVVFKHPEIQRVKSVSSLPGLGPIRHMEGTGKHDKNKIRIELPKGGMMWHVEATAEGLKKIIRKARPEEASELEEIDHQIQELRERRKAVQKKARQKAHVVTLKEVLEQTTLSKW